LRLLPFALITPTTAANTSRPAAANIDPVMTLFESGIFTAVGDVTCVSKTTGTKVGRNVGNMVGERVGAVVGQGQEQLKVSAIASAGIKSNGMSGKYLNMNRIIIIFIKRLYFI
jgi:hypothetical protein